MLTPNAVHFTQVQEDVVMEESQDVEEMDSGNVADRITVLRGRRL